MIKINLHNEDCLHALVNIDDNSIDSIVTDPPYGLKFMGKKWDYDVPSVDVWKECLRVLKPGGHALIACGTRTQHRMTVNIEDAGFEIRDVVTWMYGSGFPKSHNLENEFEGWGTALKPACEFWTLARKPISEKTVSKNVLKWGTGAINIDGCRVGYAKTEPNLRDDKGNWDNPLVDKSIWGSGTAERRPPDSQGRWPANLILGCCGNDPHDSDCAALILDGKSGFSSERSRTIIAKPNDSIGTFKTGIKITTTHGDSGGASRFFYCAKASKSERNAGLEGMPKKMGGAMAGGEETRPDRPQNRTMRENHHPTVKPLKLMTYLCRLITPPGGTVLDPFMGSGSTGVAAKKEGFKFIGVEREKEYLEIAERRIANEL